MRRLWLIIVILFPILIQTRCVDTQRGEWQVFTHEELGFSASFPSEVTREELEFPTSIGPVPMYSFSSVMGDMVFGVNCTIMPDAHFVPADSLPVIAHRLVDGCKRLQMKAFKAVSQRDDTLSCEGGFGREYVLTFTNQGVSVIVCSRVFCVQPRSYQIVAMGSPESLLKEDVERFFASVSIAGLTLMTADGETAGAQDRF